MASSDSEPEFYSQEDASQEEEEEENDLEVIKELGEAVAKHLIHAHSLGMVSKKTDLLPRNRRRLWDSIKARAKQLIRETFGYTVQEAASDGDACVFLVDMETLGDSTDHLDTGRKMDKIFLFIVLGYITLKGPPVPEAQIMGFLTKLGIDGEESPFGNSKDLLTTKLPAQYYLKRSKVDDNLGRGEVCFRYDWGPRSLVEVDREQLLNEFSTIMGKPVRSFVQVPSAAATARN